MNGGTKKDVTTALDKGSFTFSISGNDFADGDNTIRVFAEDNEGNTGSATVKNKL